jgi:hypothetical protein
MHIEPWKKGELAISDHDVWCAQVIRTLRQAGPSLPPEVLNMSIPQKHCCFAFGPNKISLPAGAVLRLWAVDPVSTGICPDCGGEVLATASAGCSKKAATCLFHSAAACALTKSLAFS